MNWFFDFFENFRENWSYKIIALLIALILWLTILGRRDFVFTKNMDLDFRPPMGATLVSASIDKIKVKVSGSRLALKKFLDGASSQSVIFDLSAKRIGEHDLLITPEMIDVPVGVKILSIRPVRVVVELSEDKSAVTKPEEEGTVETTDPTEFMEPVETIDSGD